jgi:hypothetical protein
MPRTTTTKTRARPVKAAKPAAVAVVAAVLAAQPGTELT